MEIDGQWTDTHRGLKERLKNRDNDKVIMNGKLRARKHKDKFTFRVIGTDRKTERETYTACWKTERQENREILIHQKMHRERNWGGCGVKVKRFPSFAATLEVLGSNPAWGEIFCKNFYSVCFISRTFKKTFSYFRSYKGLKQLLSVEGALRLFPKCQFPDLQQSRLLFRRTTFGKLT